MLKVAATQLKCNVLVRAWRSGRKWSKCRLRYQDNQRPHRYQIIQRMTLSLIPWTWRSAFERFSILRLRPKKNRKREQDIMQQIHEAQARILEKDKEVCNLQAQILEELRERQEMAREVLEKDFKILCLQESCAGSQARALDADTCSVFKTAAESSCSLKVGSSNVASGVRRTPASNSHVNQFANACGSILPTLPKQDMMFSPQQSPQRGVRQLQVTPPSSPNLSIWASLPQQFKSHEKEVPSWGQPCGNAMSRRVVMQNLQVRNTSRPMTYR